MKSLLIFTIFLLPFISGCKSSARQEYEKIIKEWTGKTVLFPDSMTLVTGKKITPPKSQFTIVAYFDSIGCTGCRMRLPYWKEFIEKVNSTIKMCDLSLLIIADSDNHKELENLIERYDFPYYMIIDSNAQFNKLNIIPQKKELQTFLLDKQHKIIAIGNPTWSSAIENLYLRLLALDNYLVDDKTQELDYQYDFGLINPNQEVCYTLIYSLVELDF